MKKDYRFVNSASLQKIPEELEGIIQDTIDAYKAIIPEDHIICIMASGSLTRGDFKPGISDFDTSAVVGRPLTEKEDAKRLEVNLEIEAKYRPLGVAKVDIGFVDLDKLVANELPKMSFIFMTDGVSLYGNAPSLVRTWPDPGNELSVMLNHSFAKTLGHYRLHLNGERVFAKDFSVDRWIAKQGLRQLFGITMNISGLYVIAMDEYVGAIKESLPEEARAAQYLYDVYLTGGADPGTLLKTCSRILELAQQTGAATKV